MAPHLCDLPKIHSRSLIMRRTLDKLHIALEGHPKNYLTSSLQNSQEEPKETQQLNVMWYSGWDPGTEKDIRLNKGCLNKLWTLVTNNGSVLVH